ncbi:MBL fold metallo-hydrolase [Nocardia suismassiliense]|uniref:MBL fold metallo-hydrolase n=1 Tax=Nocardia suismassiliense TaxID=2077092 RepID=UPI000D1FC275|nr:MBL fold metallo-hydrolase [Nocardia suismassiliense]
MTTSNLFPTTLDRLIRPAPIRSVQIGEITVTYLPDGLTPLEPRLWFPGSGGIWDNHPEYLDAAGDLIASVGGLLVEHGDRSMLIDCGFGPMEVDTPYGHLRGGAMLNSLAALGCTPARIEAVALTHLHADHLGWTWMPDPETDTLPFAEATIYLGEAEWRHRAQVAEQGTVAQMIEVFAKQVRTVRDGQEIFPGVHVLSMAGHTVGHTAYVIESAGQTLIAFGDALTSSIQIAHPHLVSEPDHDPALATEARRRLVRELAKPNTLGFGCHFADVQFGRVISVEDTVRWRPHPNDDNSYI